jgi:hypothetical protein
MAFAYAPVVADELVTNDPESEGCFSALAERIAWEMSARLAIGDRVDTPEGIKALAELVADTVLDGFVVRLRTEALPRYVRKPRA